MSVDMAALLADVQADTDILDGILSGISPAGPGGHPLSEAAWDTPTPSPGWMVRDQITHLAFFDDAATMAAVDPDRFVAEAKKAAAAGFGFVDEISAANRGMPAKELHDWFLTSRGRLIEVFGAVDPKARLPWYGPAMSAVSFVTARLMETWAHGQDVADALGVTWPQSVRLRHVAEIGVRAFPNSYRARGLPVPETPVRVELTGPDGDLWTWGPEGGADSVRGPALDFCRVATQRLHVTDAALLIEGPVATEWLSIAQAFAGPPGPGRAPAGTAQ